MTRTITLDPVSRIEGHLRIELEISGGKVLAARSSGTSFRGFELILCGRDPRDAPQIAQRICGVCPVPHGRTACEAVEAALGLTIGGQALQLRNILLASNFIESHLVHFYVLALPDFIAGLPSAGGWPPGEPPRAWKTRGPLDAARYATNQVRALKARRHCHAIIGALAGKAPHAPGVVVGGATARVDATTRAELLALAGEVRAFVLGPYLEDLSQLVEAYPAYRERGASGVSLLAHPAFPLVGGGQLFAGGLIDPQGLTRADDPAAIRESLASALYQSDSPRHPAAGATVPEQARQQAYSWIKAPRCQGAPCEVGPLARAVLGGRDPGGRGVWARHLARQQEAAILAEQLGEWLSALGLDTPACDSFPTTLSGGQGQAQGEAPRGAIGHWLAVEGGKIARYQVISPTTWNASPRDEAGQPGPLEQALAGLSIADEQDPIEALRVVHSFDPCVQCAVH